MQKLTAVDPADIPFLRDAARLYRSTLLDDVIPFWLRHGIDRRHGGLGNVIDDAGRELGTDKFLWSQGRALWTFSALLNRLERRPEWRDAADHVFAFLAARGRDADGRWVWRLDKDGIVLDGATSIYVDGFVLAGLTEYHKATGDATALRLALETYDNVLARLRRPGSYATAPYPIPPGLKTHGVAMLFSLFFFELGTSLSREDITAEGVGLAREILGDFHRPERDAILEYVSLDGRFIDTPEGRACVPGHAIESMWFLMSIFERFGDRDAIRTCCRLVRRHLELAWDEEHGGLTLALDIDGASPPFWRNPTVKAWWVHVEALVATAYAYLHCRERWCLEWHRRVQDYAFAHYPVATGEWTQWLDREGRPTSTAALPVKDPFHLPRGLLELVGLLEGRLLTAPAR